MDASWIKHRKLAPHGRTIAEIGDGPFCNWDSTGAACAMVRRCSESTTPCLRHLAPAQACALDGSRECVLRGNAPEFAPIVRRASAGMHRIVGQEFHRHNDLEIGSSEIVNRCPWPRHLTCKIV